MGAIILKIKEASTKKTKITTVACNPRTNCHDFTQRAKKGLITEDDEGYKVPAPRGRTRTKNNQVNQSFEKPKIEEPVVIHNPFFQNNTQNSFQSQNQYNNEYHENTNFLNQALPPSNYPVYNEFNQGGDNEFNVTSDYNPEFDQNQFSQPNFEYQPQPEFQQH